MSTWSPDAGSPSGGAGNGVVFSRSASVYDAVYSYKDYAAEADRLHRVIQERSPGAATLLDVACGTGKHLEGFRRW